jgi:type IV secretory pathway TrbD component
MVGIRSERQQSPQTNRLRYSEQLRDLSSARQLTTGLIREINATDIRMAGTSITVAQLAAHFQQRELGCSNGRISYSTKKAYQGYLGKWIVPRWGDYILPNIKAVEVELWLKHLQRAPGMPDKAQQKRRTNRVFKSLHKPLTYLGVERTLFYFVCVGAVGAFNLFNSTLAGIAVFIGGFAFGHWVTNSDPAFLRILAKSERYKLRYDAAKQQVPFVEVV